MEVYAADGVISYPCSCPISGGRVQSIILNDLSPESMRRKRRNSSFRVSTVQTPTRRQPPGICHTSFSLLNRNLYIAYLLKEKFREVFCSKDENEATLCLILWIRMCMKSGVSQLKRFAKCTSCAFKDSTKPPTTTTSRFEAAPQDERFGEFCSPDREAGAIVLPEPD